MTANIVQSIQEQVESPHVESSFKQDGQTWLKVYIADTDYINKNGWGLSDQEVIDELNKTGIDRPGLLTDYIYHPRGLHNIATAGLSAEQIVQKLLEQQEKEARVIYRHKSFYRDKDNPKRIYSNVLVTDPKAVEAIDEGKIPQYVSAAAYLFDQPTGKGISKRFHFIHTSIVRKPAFPFAHAIIKAKCTGSEGVCTENLAVAGIETQDYNDNAQECGCPFVKKLTSLVSASQKPYIELVNPNDQETPKQETVKEELEKKAEAPATQQEAKVEIKAPIKVPEKEQAKQATAEQPAPVNTEEFFNFQRSENEQLRKRIAELEAKEKQRDFEKRREIIASHVNRVYEHDPKKASEEINKYLSERYQALQDDALIEVLKDRFGEQVIEVKTPNTNKRLVKAGLEDFVTKDANLKGSESSTTKKTHPLVNFSSVMNGLRNNGGIQ